MAARRAICLLAGSLCVAAAVLPPVATHDGLFAVHIGQHLLLGMTGPAFPGTIRARHPRAPGAAPRAAPHHSAGCAQAARSRSCRGDPCCLLSWAIIGIDPIRRRTAPGTEPAERVSKPPCAPGRGSSG